MAWIFCLRMKFVDKRKKKKVDGKLDRSLSSTTVEKERRSLSIKDYINGLTREKTGSKKEE